MPKRKIALKFPWLSPDEMVGELVRWLAVEGDRVEIEQDVAEFSINGLPFMLPSPLDGVLMEIHMEPGTPVEPGETLAIILAD